MDEKALISQLKTLKQIKPSQDWVLLAKNRILGEGAPEDEQSFEGRLLKVKQFPALGWRFVLRFGFLKPALAFSTLTILIAFMVWTWASLPGDTLYPVKKAATQVNLLTEDPVNVNLNMAAESARVLKEIAQKNDVEKLAPAIKEYQQSVKQAAESLDNPPKGGDQVLKIAEKVNQIEQQAKEIEELLQTEIAKQEREELTRKARAVISAELKEIQNKLAEQVAGYIADLESQQLTEEQQGLLQQAKDAYKAGEYETAWQLIVELSGR